MIKRWGRYFRKMDKDATYSEGEVVEGAPLMNGDGAPSEPLGQADAKAAEYLDLLQRERAAFINFRRRSEAERAESQHYATGQLLKKLLPVVDDLDRALTLAPPGEPWVEGVRMIARKFHSLLEAEGVTPVDAVGQPFDPTVHEAVAYDEGGDGPDVVVAEFARGYRHRDRVLRPAMVRVGKGQAGGNGGPAQAGG